MSVSTYVDVVNKGQKGAFIGKISTLHKKRKHIEVPKDVADDFEPGDYVSVKLIGF